MSKAREIYNWIYNDEEIRKIYQCINDREEANPDAWCHHNFNHVNNVKDIVVQILNKLNCDEELIEEAKIAAILHDVGAVQGKQNHAHRSYEFCKDYFEKNNIQLRDNNLILEAIKNHSEGFETDNLVQLSLILADKLDIKHTRPTMAGLLIPGNRQFGNVQDVVVDVDNNSLNVKFVVNNDFNKKELEDYYFTKKVSSAIKSFATKLELEYKIFLNSEEWKAIY